MKLWMEDIGQKEISWNDDVTEAHTARLLSKLPMELHAFMELLRQDHLKEQQYLLSDQLLCFFLVLLFSYLHCEGNN